MNCKKLALDSLEHRFIEVSPSNVFPSFAEQVMWLSLGPEGKGRDGGRRVTDFEKDNDAICVLLVNLHFPLISVAKSDGPALTNQHNSI